MSSRPKFNSPEAIQRRLKEGRGQGVGSRYIPWIQIYDFPSWGLRFRSYSPIPQRAVHTLSMLEHHNVALAEDVDDVEDLQENVPLLNTQKSQDIASDQKIRHPRASKTCPLVMSTDLRLTIRTNGEIHYKIWTTKYTDELRNWRTQEKLLIDELYWNSEPRTTWELKTEANLPYEFLENMKWLRVMLRPGALFGISANDVILVQKTMRVALLREDTSLMELAHWCDAHLGLAPGNTQLVVRYLLATRIWRTNLRKLINPLQPLTLRDQ